MSQMRWIKVILCYFWEKKTLSDKSWLVQKKEKKWCDSVSSHGAWCINCCVHKKKNVCHFLHTNQYLQRKNVQWESKHLMHYLMHTYRCWVFFPEQFEPFGWGRIKKKHQVLTLNVSVLTWKRDFFFWLVFVNLFLLKPFCCLLA